MQAVPPEYSVLLILQALTSLVCNAFHRYDWGLDHGKDGLTLDILATIRVLFRVLFANRASLAMENLALRQQLAVLKRSAKRPPLRQRDRIFWVWLRRLWSGWRVALLIVKPETVIKWHQQGFGLYWRWKSRRRKPGRPRIEPEIRRLIRRMSQENPIWGAPRIQAELLLLGHDVAESTIAEYIDRIRKPPSPSWRAFLKNHSSQIAAIDFFTAPTATFNILYCLVILRHSDRRILHTNVTAHPSSEWTGRWASCRALATLLSVLIAVRPPRMYENIIYPSLSPSVPSVVCHTLNP